MSSPTIQTTLGLSRRFLNLIVAGEHNHAAKSLHCVDLARHELFHHPTTPPPPHPMTLTTMVERMKLPRPNFTFRATRSSPTDFNKAKIHCFPLDDQVVVCADHLGRAFLHDARARLGGTMPSLSQPKRRPVAIFVPKPHVDADFDTMSGGSSLLVMERAPEPEDNQYLEAFVFGRTTTGASIAKSWQCRRVPPPPYVDRDRRCPEISSYAVLDGGARVCVSADGAGTFFLDTENWTWTEAGEWTLPFHGKVEYVPELKLWFGLSAESSGHLAAADLSAEMDMDAQPRLMGEWKELDFPEEWTECKDSQLVNLGAGRFCVARFFETSRTALKRELIGGDELINEDFTVLTGVEVVPRARDASSSGNAGDGCNGKDDQLRVVPHKSRRVERTTIEALF